MQSRGDFAGRVQSRHRRLLSVGVDLDPAHHVVSGGADLHRLLGDIHGGELLELVVHPRQLLPDLVLVPPRYVEVGAAVLRGSTRPPLAVDRLGYDVASQEFWRPALGGELT